MINTRRFIFSIFIFLLFSKDGVSQGEGFIRSALLGDFQASSIDTSKKEGVFKTSNFYRLDLNFDTYKDGLLIKSLEYAQDLMIFDSKKQLVTSFKLPYIGHKSGVLKFSLHKIAKNKSLLVVFFSEGSVQYLEKFSSVRSFFITFNGGVEKGNIFFQKGPVLMEEFVEKKHAHLVTGFLSLQDLDGDGVKESILNKPKGKKVIYVLDHKNNWSAY
jgi:hypothetical protein